MVQETAECPVAVEHDDPSRVEDFLAQLFVFAVEELAFPANEVLGSDDFQLELQAAQDFCLADAELVFQSLHLLFVEGLSILGQL